MPSKTSEAIVNAVLLRIAEERKNAGMSQELLAELSGVDLGVISRAENLIRFPGMASVLDLAKALDLDFPELLREVIKDAGGSSGSRSH